MRTSPALPAALLLATALLAALPARGEEGKPARPAAPAPMQQPAPPAVNDITQAAVRSGVLACASRINQVANFLTAGSSGFGALLFAPPSEPDARLVSVSMEIPTGADSAAYASASFAPNQANGCGGMYESVVYRSESCNAVAARHFGDWKPAGALAGSVSVLEGGPFSKVFLLPAGSGCVSVKKEIIQ